MFATDAICQRGKCKSQWKCRLNHGGRHVHLCAEHASDFLHLRNQKDEGKAASRFITGCHRDEVILVTPNAA